MITSPFFSSKLNVSMKVQNQVYFKRGNKEDDIKRHNYFLSLQNWQSVYNGSNVNESGNNFV